jgi:hypothetical protein
VKRIPLSGGRAFALVDDQDALRLGAYRWRLNAGGYVIRGRENPIYLHREVLNAPSGTLVDHRNTNTLDNRRANLRVCSRSENQQNRAPCRRGSSRFRGVYWNKARQKWMAYARVNTRMKYLGVYACELDAAIAAESFRQEHMPFAAPDAELLAALAQPEPLAVAA